MSISLRGWVERSLPVRKSSHHERGFCDLDLESRQSLLGDVAISILNHTDLDLSSGSGSLLCGNLHSANSKLASILPWDRSDLVLGSADLAGSAQLGRPVLSFAKMKRANLSSRSLRSCSVLS